MGSYVSVLIPGFKPHGRLQRYALQGLLGVGRVGLLLDAVADGQPCVLHVPYLRYQHRLGFGPRYLSDALWAATSGLRGFCLPTHCDCSGDMVFSVRPRLDGVTLQALLRRMRARRVKIPRRLLLSIALPLARALQTLHEAHPQTLPAPACHGRLTPSRVLLCDDGTLSILGMPSPAGWVEGPWLSPMESSRLCELPPELLEGFPLTPAGDVYLLSLLIYTMWVLDNPHDHHTARETLQSVFSTPPALRDSMRMGPELRQLIEEGLSPRPEHRPTLPQLIHGLAQVLQEDGGVVPRDELASLKQQWIPNTARPPDSLLHTTDAEMLMTLLHGGAS